MEEKSEDREIRDRKRKNAKVSQTQLMSDKQVLCPDDYQKISELSNMGKQKLKKASKQNFPVKNSMPYDTWSIESSMGDLFLLDENKNFDNYDSKFITRFSTSKNEKNRKNSKESSKKSHKNSKPKQDNDIFTINQHISQNHEYIKNGRLPIKEKKVLEHRLSETNRNFPYSKCQHLKRRVSFEDSRRLHDEVDSKVEHSALNKHPASNYLKTSINIADGMFFNFNNKL